MNSLALNWRPHNAYPIILLDTEKWQRRDMIDIRRTWKTLDFKFISIKDVFESVPKNLNESQFEDVLKGRPIATLNYKRMCSFFVKGFTQVPMLMSYRYLLRLDDDTCLLDSINFDLFRYMHEERATYAYSHIWRDNDFVVEGMWDFVHKYVEDNGIQYKNPALHNAMLTMRGYPQTVPCFNTNFEIIHTGKYRDPAVTQFVDAVVDSNMIFHRRWGDAPLRVPTMMLHYKEHELLRLDSFEVQHSSWTVFEMTESTNTSNPDLHALPL
jgi:hypothetical protein